MSEEPFPGAPLSFTNASIDARARHTLADLGRALLTGSRSDPVRDMMRGSPVPVDELRSLIGADGIDALLEAGLAAPAAGIGADDRGDQVRLAVTISAVGGVLAAIPKVPWGEEVVYLGDDSIHLIDAALRLAPRGRWAADLGTGTGLAAAILASRYEGVIGTDLAPSVATAADLTLALNRHAIGPGVAVAMADVARGLRPDVFDLVVANAPWVPLASQSPAPRELFSHGGDDGVALPARFLREGAALLAEGGVAVTLALDVEVATPVGVGDPGGADQADETPASSRSRPLRAVVDQLADEGYAVARLDTPFNRDRPHLAEVMAQRQPSITAASHVAVVVARPTPTDPTRRSLRVAIDALRRRWDRMPLPPTPDGA